MQSEPTTPTPVEPTETTAAPAPVQPTSTVPSEHAAPPDPPPQEDWREKYEQLKADKEFWAEVFKGTPPPPNEQGGPPVLTPDQKELNELRAWRQEQEAARRAQQEAQLTEQYGDLLDASDEVTDVWTTLVERGVDMHEAADYVRYKFKLATNKPPAPQPDYLEGARRAETGDRAQHARETRHTGSLDAMLIDSANAVLSRAPRR